MNRDLIDRYLADADTPKKAIAGLTVADLNAFPIPGTWSIQQIIIHLQDSDLIASDRMKRIIAEENPSILGYDETAFTQKLFVEKQDVGIATELFRLNRIQTATILKLLPDAAFERVGMHSERGRESLAELLKIYVDHLEGHMKHLREKRRLLGKPLLAP